MNIGVFQFPIFLEIIVLTILMLLLALLFIKQKPLRIMAIFVTLSYFFYSGYGIAYSFVDDSYVSKYFVYLLCLLLPFSIFGGNVGKDSNYMDDFIERSPRFLHLMSILYLFSLFIPLVYPRFKLFDIFYSGFQGLIGYYDMHNEYESNRLIGMVDAFRFFFRPFFYIYLTQLQIKTGLKKPLLLLLLSILFSFMRYGYLSRYQLILNTLVVLFFVFSFNGYKLQIKGKQVLLFFTLAVLSVPFLYAFTFIRVGESAQSGLSYMDSMNLLLEGEVYYPIYYNHILSSSALASQTARGFILWLIFLPIPSFLWPGKPRISPDAFTYSLTGKSITDAGYASSLPSLLGESFMFFGINFYWVEALIIGCVMVLIIKYLSKHKTTSFYMINLIIFSLTIGRGGASSYMSTIINGVVSIVLLNIYLSLTKRQ